MESDASVLTISEMNNELHRLQQELLGAPSDQKKELKEKTDDLDSDVAMKRADLDIALYEEKRGNENEVLLSHWLYRKKKTVSTANDVSPYVRKYATIKETLVLDIHCTM